MTISLTTGVTIHSLFRQEFLPIPSVYIYYADKTIYQDGQAILPNFTRYVNYADKTL